MLVLSRKVGEAIVIGGGIVVRVAEVSGGRVRLAIDAPRSCRVDREEVRDRIVDAGFVPAVDVGRLADEPITVRRPRRVATVI
ncbi:MAG TPA: carbon storage regulator [Gemmataceae bacterium]|nr:carbon storage regulator [Gemmataceae bacterium]